MADKARTQTKLNRVHANSLQADKIAATLAGLLRRQPQAHKYDFGHVLVVGGSPGMVGAPLLAAEAALRTGAGLVTIAAPAAVAGKLDNRVKEIMTLHLPTAPTQAVKELTTFIKHRRVSVLIIGPGQAATAKALDTKLLLDLTIPIIVDAGALAAFSQRLTMLQELGTRNHQLILTPHSGEFEKLSGSKLPADRAGQRRVIRQFAKTRHLTLVLKGHHTLVADAKGALYENTTGNPGMATAGTGDALTGVIAGLIAQGLASDKAAEAGVYLHGLAGDLAAKSRTQPGMIASDLIAQLPAAFKEIDNRQGIDVE